MKLLFTLISICTISAFGQKMPPVFFNHVFLGIDSADIKALRQAVTENGLATFVTRTTYRKTDTFTNSYLYGIDNYFEIKGCDMESEGASGLAFSTEYTGEIYTADSLLKSTYNTELHLSEKNTGEKMIPWYNVVYFNDSVFHAKSNIFFWLMEYRPEYFDFYHFPYSQNHISTADFLDQYSEHRKNKDLKRFTSMTLNVTEEEKVFFSNLFMKFGYVKLNSNTYKAPGNFIFHFKGKHAADKYTIASMEFEADNKINKTLYVSKNIKIVMYKGKGSIFFGSK